MKMKHAKFVSIATTLGLGVSLLAGCSSNPEMSGKYKKEEDDDDSSGGRIGSYSSSGSSHSSTFVPVGGHSGSKGIGFAKSGGAGS